MRNRLLALILGTVAAGGCAAAGMPQLGTPSVQEEIEQGRRADAAIRAEFGVYDSPELQGYVDRVGHSLAAVSERPQLPWTFRVLDSPVVNAFALPGGFVYLTRGLVAHMNSEAEMAGVLGHEIGHVTGRHGAGRQQRSALASLGILVGSVLAPQITRPLVASGLAQNALGLLMLKYSRDQELDADERGLRYTAKAGYDPRGIGGFFETLQSLEQEGDRERVPGWIATHPEVDDRIERSERLAAEVLDSGGTGPEGLVVGRTEHLFVVDGIVFGDDPRQGFMEGDDFLHPGLGFAFTLPTGWEVNNGPQAVVAVSSEEDAIIQLTLADVGQGSSPAAYVRDTLQRMGADVIDSGRRRVNGLDAVEARFRVASREQRYSVVGLWISFDGNLYELLGISSPGSMPDYLDTLEGSLESFRELRDPDVLAVEPARLRVRRVGHSMPLSELAGEPEVAVKPSTIGLINRLQLSTSLQPGSLVKLVVGGRGVDGDSSE